MIKLLKEKNEEERIFHLIQCGMAFWNGSKPEGSPTRIVVSREKSVSDAVIEGRR